jgi:hypothetical protein
MVDAIRYDLALVAALGEGCRITSLAGVGDLNEDLVEELAAGLPEANGTMGKLSFLLLVLVLVFAFCTSFAFRRSLLMCRRCWRCGCFLLRHRQLVLALLHPIAAAPGRLWIRFAIHNVLRIWQNADDGSQFDWAAAARGECAYQWY